MPGVLGLLRLYATPALQPCASLAHRRSGLLVRGINSEHMNLRFLVDAGGTGSLAIPTLSYFSFLPFQSLSLIFFTVCHGFIHALSSYCFPTSINFSLLTGANISILTTTQSSIAADLDSFEEATWFTSSYLIAMSALAPLMGRLSQVFSPRLCMFFSTKLICIGSLATSLANSLRWFLLGRSVTGAGAAGILIVATIIVIQMVSAKRRGLFIGLANTGMTVGLSLGAVIAGGLEPKIGWVSIP